MEKTKPILTSICLERFSLWRGKLMFPMITASIGYM